MTKILINGHKGEIVVKGKVFVTVDDERFNQNLQMSLMLKPLSNRGYSPNREVDCAEQLQQRGYDVKVLSTDVKTESVPGRIY